MQVQQPMASAMCHVILYPGQNGDTCISNKQLPILSTPPFPQILFKNVSILKPATFNSQYSSLRPWTWA